MSTTFLRTTATGEGVALFLFTCYYRQTMVSPVFQQVQTVAIEAPLGAGAPVLEACRTTWSCTASVRLIPGVLSKPVCVRNMSLSAGLKWGGYCFPHLRMLVC
jgi:hypothetical protein